MKWLIVILLVLLILPVQARAGQVYRTYANMVMKNLGIRGVEIWPGMAVKYQNELIAAHPNWIKTYLKWSEVEVIQGVYTWPANFDADYQIIKATGARLIVVLKMSPQWARIDTRECGRVTDIPAFTEFARQAATRYPYITIWEVGNEQDLAWGLEGYYGCWGSPDEAYYGGAYYATVINPIRAAIRQINPLARVYVGGLALPCLDCPQAGYLEGALRAGASFDGVAFHHYDSFSGGATSPEGQVNFLRQVMSKYNYTRPIIMSETSMLYPSEGEVYEQEQARYVNFIYNEARRLGLDAFVWYTFPDSGWNHSGMMEGTRLKPVYFIFVNYDD